MKLYSHPGSCSSAAEFTLHEAGADFEHIKLDLFSDRTLPDGRNFSEINPKGYVPALELDNGEVLTEVTAVLQYVADKFPNANLIAAPGTLERSRTQEWLAYLNTELHKTFLPIFSPDYPDEVKAMHIEKFAKRLTYIDEKLANQDYLGGDQFTIADAYLFVILGWAPMVSFDLSPFSKLLAFQARVSEREAAQKTLASMAQ